MNINIITPCTRPENLQAIYESFNFDFTFWWIVFDISHDGLIEKYKSQESQMKDLPKVNFLYVKGGIWGNLQRNTPLQSIPDGFCYFLDDDNVIHPSFGNRLSDIHEEENKLIYIFEQQVSPNKVKIIRIRPKHIDLAQYITHRSLFDIKIFPECHDADYYFIKHFWNTRRDDCCLIPEVLCYYNKLRWGIQ